MCLTILWGVRGHLLVPHVLVVCGPRSILAEGRKVVSPKHSTPTNFHSGLQSVFRPLSIHPSCRDDMRLVWSVYGYVLGCFRDPVYRISSIHVI